MAKQYVYTDKAPMHLVNIVSTNPATPGLVKGQEWKRGIMPHGPKAGLIEEKDLTEELVEWIESRDDGHNSVPPVYLYRGMIEESKSKDKATDKK